jgi:hypothetical protein
MTVIADARRFADMQALYRLYDEKDRLLYIGVTGDLGQRLGEHSAKRWFPLVDHAKFEWLPTRAAALLAERRAIIAEHPRYNRQVIEPPEPARKAVARRRARVPKAAPEPPRNLLSDLDVAVLGDERIRLRDVIALLRSLAPGWEPYQKMTGVRLRDELKLRGVRVINTGSVLRLDPADLRVVTRKAG